MSRFPSHTSTVSPRAVLFDIDGVLVDSYEAHFVSWKKLAANYDRECTQEDFARGFGRTTREVLLDQWADMELDEARLTHLDDEKEDLYRQEIAENFPEMPGARALITHLAEHGWQMALGSSGPRENVDLAAEKLGVGDLLRATVSGNDVARGKPDPEVFLTAAARLETPPENCIVIEDAQPGIQAAQAGGMLAIGFVSRGRTAEELSAADRLIHSLEELNHDLLTDMLQKRTASKEFPA